jgi:hypothetical protein
MATNTDATPIIFARVPRALVAALDRRVKQQQRQQPGARVTRSDVIRQLLYQALGDEVEAPRHEPDG